MDLIACPLEPRQTAARWAVGALLLALTHCAAPPESVDTPPADAPTTNSGPLAEAGVVPLLDRDGDGSPELIDCDDLDPDIGPGALETLGDGVDQDCDGGDDTTWVLGSDYEWDAPARVAVIRAFGTVSLAVSAQGFSSPDEEQPEGATLLWPLRTHGRAAPPGQRTRVHEQDGISFVDNRVDVERTPDGGLELAWSSVAYPITTDYVNVFHAPISWDVAAQQWDVGTLDFELGNSAAAPWPSLSLDSAVGEGGETWHVACRPQSIQAKASVVVAHGATDAPDGGNPQGHPGGQCFWVEEPSPTEGTFANCLPQTPCEVVRFRPFELPIYRLEVVDRPPWTGRMIQSGHRRDGWLGFTEVDSSEVVLTSAAGEHPVAFDADAVLAFDFRILEDGAGSPRTVLGAVLDDDGGARVEVRYGDGPGTLDGQFPVELPAGWTPVEVTVDVDELGVTVTVVAADPSIEPASRLVWASVAW